MSNATVTIADVLGRHPVHPFPARMAPGIALDVLSGLRKRATVLDPMMGSGTVLAIARAKGHRAIGFDIDPLAVLISSVWTRSIDRNTARSQAKLVLDRAVEMATRLSLRDAYPREADRETRAFVRYWFDERARIQLASLARSIRVVKDPVFRDVLWCAFSRLIIAKQAGASRAMDLAHSRPHRAFDRAPRMPFPSFLEAVERVVSNCLERDKRGRGPRPSTRLGDARSLPTASRTVDFVFTSPPYLNAIDYLRCSKFSLVWMDHSIQHLRQVRSTAVGTEVGSDAPIPAGDPVRLLKLRPMLPPRMEAILRRYVIDMNQAVSEVARVLKPGGKALYVVGENTLRGTFVPTARAISLAARSAGLELVERRTRVLPSNRRYLPPPTSGRAALDTRMRREVVLLFERHQNAVRPD